MNTVLIILGVLTLALIALRLFASRPFESRPPTVHEEDAELSEPLLQRAGRRRLRLSAALFYFAPWLERAVVPSDAATAELLGHQSTRRLEDSARRLLLAGSPGGLRPNEWLGIRYLTGVVGALFGYVAGSALVALPGRPINGTALFAVATLGALGALFGYAIPDLWLSRNIRARQRAIVRMLPEMLDLLAISIQAGLGLDAALSRVVERLNGPLPDEFRRALLEIRLGKTRREALRNIVSRTGSRPLTNFISGIIQAEQLGVPISRVLSLQSEQLRVEHRQRVEDRTSQAPIKMVFPMVGCILPAIWVIIFGPIALMMMLGWPANLVK